MNGGLIYRHAVFFSFYFSSSLFTLYYFCFCVIVVVLCMLCYFILKLWCHTLYLRHSVTTWFSSAYAWEFREREKKIKTDRLNQPTEEWIFFCPLCRAFEHSFVVFYFYFFRTEWIDQHSSNNSFVTYQLTKKNIHNIWTNQFSIFMRNGTRWISLLHKIEKNNNMYINNNRWEFHCQYSSIPIFISI